MDDASHESGLRYEASATFIRLLEQLGVTLAVSVYMQNQVVLAGAESGRLFMHAYTFERPMGLATASGAGPMRMAIATFQETVILADEPLLAKSLPGRPDTFEHLLVPRAVLFNGDIDAHDLVWLGNRLFAANTRFSCIAEIDGRCSFTPVWTPPFVTQLLPEDRCHLNGLAADGTSIRYATMLGRSDIRGGWSADRASSGVLMEIPSGKTILEGLCVPHSPRLFDNALYVLDSGTGRILLIDTAAGSSRAVAELPGFTRGLDGVGDVLFVGLSRIREDSRVKLPIYEKRTELICGVAALRRSSGEVLGWLRFDDTFEEIFDVKVLTGARRVGLLSVNDDSHRRALVLPGRAFWGQPRDPSAN